MQSFDKLKPHYPKVWNPELGDRYLVVWHTDNDGNHVIVAENQDNALEVWELLYKDQKNQDAMVQSCHQVTLVPVPDDIARTKAGQVYEWELNNFSQALRSTASMVFDDTQKVPDGFELCDHQEDSESRWECERCDGFRVYIPNNGIQKLFDNPLSHEIHEVWPKDSHCKKEPRPTPSWATVGPLADPSKPLMVAVTNHGHHHPGVELLTADEWVKTWDHPILFFFQGERVPIPEAFTRAEKETEAKDAERWASIREQNKKDKEISTTVQLDYLKRMMGLLRDPSA